MCPSGHRFAPAMAAKSTCGGDEGEQEAGAGQPGCDGTINRGTAAPPADHRDTGSAKPGITANNPDSRLTALH